MPGILYFYDVNGCFLRWNLNFETVSGYSHDEIARMHPLDFFTEADRPRVGQRIEEVFAQGHSSLEAPFIAKDGTATPYFFTGRQVRFEDKTCLVGVGIDISERAGAQAKLAESERKYRELVENANSIILRWNHEGVITLLNEYGQRFFGYAPEEIVGRHVIGTIVPLTESGGRDLRGLMQEICADPKAFEQSINENIRRNGERVWIAWTNRIALDAEGRMIEILSIGTDITARKLAEEGRWETEARYRKLFDCAPDGILIADARGIYLDANPSLCRMLGYLRDEIVGKNASDIVDPSEIGNIEPAIATIRSASEYQREWRFRRKDGSILEAEVTVTNMPDGNLLAMIRDIEERRQAEREREMRHRAEAADRVKSAFLATMSHELRTPLNSILGFTGIMLQKLAGPLNAEQSKQLDMVRTSARHLLALVNDVLDISKIEAGQLDVSREPFDPRKSIDKVLALIAPQMEAKSLILRADIAADLGVVIGDARRFEQILLNLLSNAVKFTNHGGIGLAAWLPPDARQVGGEQAQPAIRVQVSDTGIGIKPENLSLLFQPFRQIDSGLTRQHDGTGLGLAICRRLARLMGGEIDAVSEWGKGSTFSVTLPLEGTVKP
ncbi:MAG: PAS domain S-box protein [Fibrobacteria bacterium]